MLLRLGKASIITYESVPSNKNLSAEDFDKRFSHSAVLEEGRLRIWWSAHEAQNLLRIGAQLIGTGATGSCASLVLPVAFANCLRVFRMHRVDRPGGVGQRRHVRGGPGGAARPRGFGRAHPLAAGGPLRRRLCDAHPRSPAGRAPRGRACRRRR